MKTLYTALMASMALFSLTASAQVTFERTYDNGPSDIGTSVIALADGYIMCGSTADALNGDYDVFVTRVNLTGDVVWTNIYTSLGASDDYAAYINAAIDGGFVICGASWDAVFGDEDAFVMKIDEDGNELWIQTYDGGWSEDDGASYIVADGSNFLVAGWATTDIYDRYMWVFIIDEDGDLQWEALATLNGEDIAKKVIATDDGGLLLAGYSYDWMNDDFDGLAMKLDAFGDQDWSYYTTGAADEFFNDVIVDPAGDFLLIGSQQDDITGDYDILLENIDFDGDVIYYSYTFDYESGDDEGLRVYYNGTDYFMVGYVERMAGDYDAYIAVLDVVAGDITGDVVYGDGLDEGFIDFDIANDGGFICIGLKQITAQGATDVYLVKTDANGEVLPPVSIPTLVRENVVTIFPNPTTDVLNIRGDGFQRYRITGMDGRLYAEGTLADTSIDVTDLAHGNYMITLFKNDMAVVKKFIKQ
jgi:hypothetical protein